MFCALKTTANEILFRTSSSLLVVEHIRVRGHDVPLTDLRDTGVVEAVPVRDNKTASRRVNPLAASSTRHANGDRAPVSVDRVPAVRSVVPARHGAHVVGDGVQVVPIRLLDRKWRHCSSRGAGRLDREPGPPRGVTPWCVQRG